MRIIKFPGLRFGHTIYSYLELGSTQDKAKEFGRTGINEGVVVCARTQTKGRGRRDKNWISEPGGLFFSLIYHSLVPIIEVSNFTKNLALYVKVGIEKAVAPIYSLNLEIRGINDLYLNNKKVVGIIVETESYGLSNANKPIIFIIGCGVNTNQIRFPYEIKTIATSLLNETNYRFSRISIMKAICYELSTKLL